MRDEYAVAGENGILYRTDGFRAEAVTDTVHLSGGATLLVCRGEDTALRRRLEAAEQAMNAKDVFLSNMSHDIRTPMNAIVGLTALAKMHLDEPARVADALNKIETSSAHLLSLINDALDMSHINSGRMQIAGDYFALNDLIHDTLVIVRPLAEKKGHSLRFLTESIAEETLKGDSLRLRQVFVNIISNAVKYTPDGGSITVRFSETPAQEKCVLVFECEDNGIGMSADFLERVFEPFERVQNSTVSHIEGTGLGMSIVKKLTDAMGGKISIRSKPHEGTCVTIRIPFEYRQDPPHTEALAGKRLLVAEADATLRAGYALYLDGIRHTLVSSVHAAMDALADADIGGSPYDLLIIGQTLEEREDRLDFAAYIHRADPTLPLVLVSDDSWEELGSQAEQSGIVSFIPLPLLRKSLLSGLESALKSAPGETAAELPDLRGRHILLAEDNMINSEIAREMLGMTGAETELAENGAQAVERFTAAPEGYYALVLMDIQMPVMDGYEATARIRGSGRADAKTVPILAMTANTFAEDIARARAAGMDGHIAKPIDMDSLMQALRSALGR